MRSGTTQGQVQTGRRSSPFQEEEGGKGLLQSGNVSGALGVHVDDVRCVGDACFGAHLALNPKALQLGCVGRDGGGVGGVVFLKVCFLDFPRRVTNF